jgi:thioredoxin reductase
MVTTFRPKSRPIWRAATYLSSMAGSSRSPITGAIRHHQSRYGRNVAVDILFALPRNKPSASLHESLGLATVDTPSGIVLKVDERRETSMPGIYAAGDLTTPFLPSVTQASSQGAMAGIFAQQSMLV